MSAPETVDAEVVEEAGAEVVPIERHAATLWHTDNPATVLEKATETANALAPVLRDKGMLSKIGDKDHVRIEGWQTLGSMLGVTPVGVWTKPVDGGWEAKVNAQTLDGRVIGSAEAMCLRAEENWKSSDEFAIRSMAQTRAASKALASVLRFVVTLAGFAGTPAEEMPRDAARKGFASPKQEQFFRRLLKDAGGSADTINKICAYASAELEGGRSGQISAAINGLKDESKAKDVGKQLAEEAGHWSANQSDLPAPDTEGLPDA